MELDIELIIVITSTSPSPFNVIQNIPNIARKPSAIVFTPFPLTLR